MSGKIIYKCETNSIIMVACSFETELQRRQPFDLLLSLTYSDSAIYKRTTLNIFYRAMFMLMFVHPDLLYDMKIRL